MVLLDLLLAQELVYNVLSDIEAFRFKTELSMDIDYPFQQEGSRCISYLRLNLRNVVVINHEIQLLHLHILKVFLRILCDRLRVFYFLSINNRHLLHFCLEIVLNSLVVNFLDPLSMIGSFLRNCTIFLIDGISRLHLFIIVFIIQCF